MIYQAYFELIIFASRTVYISTPYLVPEETLLIALETAASAGIDVRIIVPHIPDNRLVQWAGRSYFLRLLRSGVKIYEYHKGFYHGKTLIVDGYIASVGSANLDTRSMEINFEVNALIYDEQICQELTESFFEDIKGSYEIHYEDWSQRSAISQMAESVARLFSPIL